MSTFKLYRNNSRSAEHYPFLIDVQSELLSQLETRLAIPVVACSELSRKVIKNLNPIVSIDERDYVVVTQQMAAVPQAVFGEPMIEIELDRNQVLASIDFLITGI